VYLDSFGPIFHPKHTNKSLELAMPSPHLKKEKYPFLLYISNFGIFKLCKTHTQMCQNKERFLLETNVSLSGYIFSGNPNVE
jgi:hypothetical protein